MKCWFDPSEKMVYNQVRVSNQTTTDRRNNDQLATGRRHTRRGLGRSSKILELERCQQSRGCFELPSVLYCRSQLIDRLSLLSRTVSSFLRRFCFNWGSQWCSKFVNKDYSVNSLFSNRDRRSQLKRDELNGFCRRPHQFHPTLWVCGFWQSYTCPQSSQGVTNHI